MTTTEVEHKDPQIALMLTKISALREVMELRFTAVDKAQQIDSRETQRRLEELNHAHANALVDKEKFLPRETFDAFLRETRNATEKLREDTKEAADKLAAALSLSEKNSSAASEKLSDRISHMEGKLAAYAAAMASGLAIVQILLKFLVK